jgi:hypothetical protein
LTRGEDFGETLALHVKTSIVRIGTALCAVLFLFNLNSYAQHGLLREVYPGSFGDVSALTNDVNFPDNPAEVGVLENFEAPANAGSNYGQRVSGYIVPPLTGDYTFWIASDDQSQLFLSTDEDPAKVRVIASVPSWTDPATYDEFPEQQSTLIPLEAGKRYFVEALHVQRGGSDHLSVQWQLPDGAIESPIPGSRLYVELIGAQITRPPQNVKVIEGGSATFSVQVANRGPVAYQWFKNNVPIPGETNATLFLPSVKFSDNNKAFSVMVSNEFGSQTSSLAFLTVERDVTQPTVLSVQNPGENDLVTITFSEPVSPATANNVNNYKVTGLNVLGATLDQTGRTVVLRTAPQTFGQTYELIINGIQDVADQPNTIEPDTRLEFSFSFSPTAPEIIYGANEPLGPSTRRTGLVISEIMYNPAPRADNRNLEFIELYNSQEFLENIGGYRITGALDYTFPSGTFIPPRGFLVLAPNPGDLQVVYGLPRVYGGFTNSLPNDHGHLELQNDQGAVLLEIDYYNSEMWPTATDGAGHSLVLAKPSYGEHDPRAWSASEFVGGSPGKAEPTPDNPYRTIVINEFLAHTDDPTTSDFIELFNYGANPVDISKIYISDDPLTNKFQVSTPTVIPPLGVVVFKQAQLGFALGADGERIFVRNPQGTRIIDAVRFGPQANGISMGRFPDGAPEFRALAAPTPGTGNKAVRQSTVVINEIMYDPITDGDDEYVELYNRSGKALDLSGWKIQDGISFTFPANTTLGVGGYFVVGKNIERMRTNYPHLNAANSFGDFDGSLSNGGERIALTRPEILISTNASKNLETNTIYVVENEVTYGTGGRWGDWSHGGGSSLELIDPNSDNTYASNWADSDETHKGQWTKIEWRGILDHGMTNFPPTNPSKSLHFFIEGAGEMLLDNVEVIPDGGTNVVSNPTFENGMKDWVAQGTHEDTTLETTEGFQSNQSLHVRATGRGDTASNRLRVKLNQGLTNGMIATLRAEVRWLKGNNECLLRLHGNYLEATGTIQPPANLGTPGLPNSRLIPNAGPVITRVIHNPAVPVATQMVNVFAQIGDPDRIALVRLNYRVDTNTNYVSIVMVYNGAGSYSATIPGLPSGAGAAFYIEAVDTRGGRTSFPDDAPARSCVVRFGDPTITSNFGKYRLWLTQQNINRWNVRDKSSNKPLDATFVYNDYRVVYNMGTLYSGSPFHWGGYQGPLSPNVGANYLMLFPTDDLFLGQTDFVLNLPSNIASDATGIREQIFFWMAEQVNQPHNYRRYHHLLINGVDRDVVGGRGSIFEDAQQPNADFVAEWFPRDSNGDLHKIEDWFEYNDSLGFNNLDSELIAVVTTNLYTNLPQLKKERYRWWWRKRAVNGSAHDFNELFRLVEAVNNPNDAQYQAETAALVDIDEWMGAIAIRHAAGDWDAYGYRRGKNMYAYKPENGKWNLMHWDIAFAFGLGDGPTADLFDTHHFDNTIDAITTRMMNTPSFRRSYLRMLYEIANGPMVASRVNPVIDARSAALLNNGIPVNSTETVKSWISDRRAFILGQLGTASASFAVTLNNGASFTTNRNNLVLTGTAPVQVKTITINGVEYPVTWTGVTTWSVRYALVPGINQLKLQGFDMFGNPVTGAQASMTVTYSGTPEQAAGRIVIDEINYNPLITGTEFVELHNTSKTTAFDVSGWRINGIDFTFSPGSVIGPSGFTVVPKDAAAFGELYGFTVLVAGEFSGTLDNGGETLTLLRPDTTSTNEIAVSSVTYGSALPWPQLANGTGASLQLIDPLQDITRVANWASVPNGATPGQTNSVRATLSPFPLLWVNEVQPSNLNGPTDNAGQKDPWLELYNSGATAIDLSNFYLTDDYTNLVKWQFPVGATIAAGQRKLVWVDAQPEQSTATELHANFRITPGTGSIALVGRENGQPAVFDYLNYTQLPAGKSFGAYPEGQAQHRLAFFFNTPGAANNPAAAPVQVTINEWMASNSSTIIDPTDNHYDDWIELYNAGSEAADLGGYGFTDDVTKPRLYVFPEGTVIAPKGFLFMWADSDTATNGIHLPFKLKASGETIALFAPVGTAIDTVVFGQQTNDVSQGRLPDGSANIQFLSTPTPGSSNSGILPGSIQLYAPTLANNQIAISWSSEPGVSYVVLYKNSLNDPQWQTLTTITATGPTASATDSLAQQHRFYQVKKSP